MNNNIYKKLILWNQAQSPSFHSYIDLYKKKTVNIVCHSVSDFACSSPVLNGQNQITFDNQNSKDGQWQEIDEGIHIEKERYVSYKGSVTEN